MKTIEGPGLFPAQFARHTPPLGTIDGIARWARDHGYEGVQIPTSDETFLVAAGGPPRCNINNDPSHLIKRGIYGYRGWLRRAGRERSFGWGQVDFRGIFSRLAASYFDGRRVYGWECCLEHPEVSPKNGARFIAEHIIQVTDRVFDDFAATRADAAANHMLLGVRA